MCYNLISYFNLGGIANMQNLDYFDDSLTTSRRQEKIIQKSRVSRYSGDPNAQRKYNTYVASKMLLSNKAFIRFYARLHYLYPKTCKDIIKAYYIAQAKRTRENRRTEKKFVKYLKRPFLDEEE